jgi:hypothetical protein
MGYTGNNHHAQKYDATKAYDKDLSASARLHYLENSEHDKHAAKMYGDPPAKNITKVLSEGAKHNAAPKMSADLSDVPLQEDMLSNQMGGYAGDASGAPDPTINTGNNPAPMMEALGKPALMMKKGIASMCGMKK